MLSVWVLAFIQLILRKEVGTKPLTDEAVMAMLVVFGILLPIGISLVKGRIIITESRIKVSLLPFYYQSILLESIEQTKIVQIDPIQFGGRGIRWNGRKWGFILQGAEGVELELTQGIPLVISSHNSTQLFRALNESMDETQQG